MSNLAPTTGYVQAQPGFWVVDGERRWPVVAWRIIELDNGTVAQPVQGVAAPLAEGVQLMGPNGEQCA